MRSLIGTLMLAGCVKYGPVQALHTDLETKLEAAKTDQWTTECAPVEMAAAESHKAFAELEFRQGGTITMCAGKCR